VRGKDRVDDRRVISGILHVLKSGCRWCECPPEYGPPTWYEAPSCFALVDFDLAVYRLPTSPELRAIGHGSLEPRLDVVTQSGVTLGAPA
jgi:transposase